MGRALAGALLSKGYDVVGWDRDPERRTAAAAAGVTAVGDAREAAAGSDVVFTVLPHAGAVLEVALDAERGILGGLADGALLIDMTTAGPPLAHRLHGEFTAVGRRFVDAPVSGKAPGMTVLLGAEEGELGEAEQVLRDVASSVVHCGSRGAGYAVKLVNQHIKYAWYLASSEALLVAREWGLDTRTVVEAVERSSGASRGFADAAAYFLDDAAEVAAHGPARTIAKDMVLAAELAEAAGVSSPTLSVVTDFFGRLVASDYADRPFPAGNALLETLRTGRCADDVEETLL
ncbi:NAD(P)-dependent oxidoreductase [Streptomyces sp. TRM S81-3]|uniref:NAD(P)-dependent oxidoreductase n=2 Tax=Streptomyces TaxID=1883 RepID=A0A926L9S8_9ACTN|nr:NAD(P)-dependent oxidoreductase [Streptomyces griseicoloratus]